MAEVSERLSSNPDLPDVVCVGCGYSLRGIDSDRCPECGLMVDRTRLGESRLPWVHRHRIGRTRAFWRTVWLVTFHPRRLAEEINQPVSYADARKFQWVCVLLAYVSVASGLALVDPNKAFDLGGLLLWPDRFAILVMAWIGLMFFFLTASGVASYFFHPRGLPVVRQNRAVALSYYASAALAWTPLVVGVTGLAVLAEAMLDAPHPAIVGPLAAALVTVAVAAGVFQGGAWWLNNLSLLKRTTHCGAGRVFALAMLLPLFWVLLGVLFLAVVPAAVAFIALVIVTLV